ncbi:B38 [miniopterid betaherpesvirus 1]|uniref:B38 n=1 Tax=miniopterid betaherpesvirus 1 TaxID=3070189 RepID=I3VQ13_9BETA|nr:B38 [miniopterid betaherpesvirus 1]AFK83857.1 B38 [miniopterid betaherpesvirus 1]
MAVGSWEEHGRYMSEVTCIGELVQASILGRDKLELKVREYMLSNTVVRHVSGIRVTICDLGYRYLMLDAVTKTRLGTHYPPVKGDLAVFGVSDEWRAASELPSRQIVFLISQQWDVYAFNGGVLFYVAPTMQQFWISTIVLEYENAIFPVNVHDRVRPFCRSIDELIMFYHRVALHKSAYEMLKTKEPEQIRLDVEKNRFYIMFQEIECAIQRGLLPPLFTNCGILRLNCDASFYVLHLSRWIMQNNNPVVCMPAEMTLSGLGRPAPSYRPAVATPPIISKTSPERSTDTPDKKNRKRKKSAPICIPPTVRGLNDSANGRNVTGCPDTTDGSGSQFE